LVGLIRLPFVDSCEIGLRAGSKIRKAFIQYMRIASVFDTTWIYTGWVPAPGSQLEYKTLE
jgi:hypothetical protein